MSKFFELAQFEDPESVLDPLYSEIVEPYGLKRIFDKALVGLLSEICDAMPQKLRSELVHRLENYFYQLKIRGQISCLDKDTLTLKEQQEILQTFARNSPLCTSPEFIAYLTQHGSYQRILNISPYMTKDRGLESLVVNQWLEKQALSREWLEHYCLLKPDCLHFLPVLLDKQARILGNFLSVYEPGDIELHNRLFNNRLPYGPWLICEELGEWKDQFYSGWIQSLHSINKNIVARMLEEPGIWLSRSMGILKGDPIDIQTKLAHKFMDYILMRHPLEALSNRQAFALMQWADKSNRWIDLPENVRLNFFKRFIDVRIIEQDGGKRSFVGKEPFNPCFSKGDVEESHQTHCDPRFWLQRPDGERYIDPIFEMLREQPLADWIDTIPILIGLPCKCNDAVNSCANSMLQELVQDPVKTDIHILGRAIDKFANYRDIDRARLTRVFLGRLRSCVSGDHTLPQEESLNTAYRILFNDSPAEAFSRIANAIIASKIPVCDEALRFQDSPSFCAPIDPCRLKTMAGFPAAWLTARMVEWIFLVIPPSILQGRCRFESGGPMIFSDVDRGLTLADARRLWAELCWKKLDLNKAGKEKKPEKLTHGDWIEPRACWRQAFLLSLADLGDNLNNKAHRRVHMIAQTDPDENVRKTAMKVYPLLVREKSQQQPNPLISFLKVILWFRIANRQSIGLDLNDAAMIKTRNYEVRWMKESEDLMCSISSDK